MNISKFIGVLCIAAMVWSTNSFAANVTGTISATNNNWGTGGNVASPVTITGNITVPVGQTLTIQPGCVVKGLYTITVQGTMIANGTIDKYIDWSAAAIVFSSSSTANSLNFMKMISYTDQTGANLFNNFISVNSSNVDFEHIEVQDFATNAINITGATSVVKINHCTLGAKSRAFTSTLGVATAVNIDATAAAANITISNSILGIENGNAQMAGLAVRGAAGAVTNTKVSYTFVVGTRVGAGSTETSVYTNITPGVFDVPNMRFFLADLSPAVDAADPADAFSNEPAPNGGRADCGYYGGTSQATKSQLQIRKPIAGENVKSGAAYKISWWGGMFAGPKKVEYSTNNGTNWTTINTTSALDTSISWTVPATKTGQGKIRVSYTTVTDVIGISDIFGIDSTVTIGKVCDPSKTLKNPKYFACIPYAGYRAGESPETGVEPTIKEVHDDMVMLAPYTHGIRTYGSSIHTPKTGHDYVPRLCDSLNLNLYMGVWIDNTYPDATNQLNCDQAITIVNEGHKSIKTLIVGNEYLLRAEAAHTNMVTAEANLVKWINYVKGKLPAGSTIKVSTGESYPNWLTASDKLPQAVDVVYWHVHPWWEGKAINIAAEWAATAHQKMIARLAKAGVTKPMVLAETGYPWGATQGTAIGSEAAQAQYLKDLHAYAFKVGLTYFFFEAYDEPWKAGGEGNVGDKWGLWKPDHVTPHQIMTPTNLSAEIPDCMKWEDPEAPVSVIQTPKAVAPVGFTSRNYDKIRIFNLSGKLVATLTNTSKYFGNARQYLNDARFTAHSLYVADYLSKGTTIKSEKIMLK